MEGRRELNDRALVNDKVYTVTILTSPIFHNSRASSCDYHFMRLSFGIFKHSHGGVQEASIIHIYIDMFHLTRSVIGGQKEFRTVR